MIFLPPERIFAALAQSPEGGAGRSSMREHAGIINIESLLVKSMDERGNFRVASVERQQSPPRLLLYKYHLREY
jgi:hypothetical protein